MEEKLNWRQFPQFDGDKTPHPSVSYPEVGSLGKSGGKGEPSSVERPPVFCYLLEEE